MVHAQCLKTEVTHTNTVNITKDTCYTHILEIISNVGRRLKSARKGTCMHTHKNLKNKAMYTCTHTF